METGELIALYRKQVGLTIDELAQKSGVPKGTLNKIINGITKAPTLDTMKSIARALGKNLSDFDEQGLPDDTESLDAYDNIIPFETKRIPLLGSIAAGEPIFAEQDYESFVSCGNGIHADFALRVKGDSMINARIMNGDIVFIRKQPSVENGEIAAVIIEDEATLKRVFFYQESQKLVLSPENAKYEPFMFVGDELENVRILGKAIAFQSDVK